MSCNQCGKEQGHPGFREGFCPASEPLVEGPNYTATEITAQEEKILVEHGAKLHETINQYLGSLFERVLKIIEKDKE